MTTFELVKSQIVSVTKASNTVKEIEAVEPKLKRQRVNEKMTYILQNPETLKWAVVSDAQVNELNNLYQIAKTGMSTDEDPFLLTF